MTSTILLSNDNESDTTDTSDSDTSLMKDKQTPKQFRHQQLKTNTKNISKKDIYFINKAIIASKKSLMLMKHGCVITSNNKFICEGYNSYRNQFKDNFVGKSCSCHAEMHGLRNAIKLKSKKQSLSLSILLNNKSLLKSQNQKLKKYKFDVYVVRYSINNELRDSTPCYDCYMRMKYLGVRNIIYTKDDGSIHKERLRDFNPKVISLGRQYINSGFVTIKKGDIVSKKIRMSYNRFVS